MRDRVEGDRGRLAKEEESNFAVVVVLGVAGLVTGFAWTTQCAAQYACAREGTCHDISEGSCSFRNAVTPAGLRAFNMSHDVSALASLTRGVCAPGERQTIEFATRTLTCARSPAFPDALSREAGEAGADEPHRKTCGRWIDANKAPHRIEYYSFFDEDDVERDVLHAVKEDFSTYYQSSDRQLFQSACERILTNGALAPATASAYDYLKNKMPSVAGSEVSETDALKAIGTLNAHYCDAPTLLGLGFAASGEQFVVAAVDGSLLGSDAAVEALQAMGEGALARDDAREFAREIASAPGRLLRTPTAAEMSTIFEASVEKTWVDDSLSINSPVSVRLADDATTLSTFLYAMAETSPRHARHYLLAEAARCSLSVRSTISGDFGSSVNVQEAVEELRRGRPPAVAFGKLRSDRDARFGTLDERDALRANRVRWSSRFVSEAVLRWSSASSSASSACYRATKIAFAEDFDRAVHDKLIESKLVDTVLAPTIEILKNAVAAELENGRASELLVAPARAAAAAAARAVEFRVAGAPRRSPFGRSREFATEPLYSDDGALTMLLKRANAVYLDRTSMALDGSTLCDHEPFFAATERNAYLLRAAPCAMLFPGILIMPFASARYDEPSLYSRIGYVIAHEVAHVASRLDWWDAAAAARLLVNYSASTWYEAAADLAAVDAVVATGAASREQMCDHVSQVWCARVPKSANFDGLTHPAPNHRGDAACAWLRLP